MFFFVAVTRAVEREQSRNGEVLPMTEKLLSAQQVADARGLDESTVIRLRKERKIPAIKLGYRTFVFRLSAVDAALSKLEVKAISLKGSR